MFPSACGPGERAFGPAPERPPGEPRGGLSWECETGRLRVRLRGENCGGHRVRAGASAHPYTQAARGIPDSPVTIRIEGFLLHFIHAESLQRPVGTGLCVLAGPLS